MEIYRRWCTPSANYYSNLDAERFNGLEPLSCTLREEIDNARNKHTGKRSHGIRCQRPTMVLYDKHNPDEEAIGAVVKSGLRARPDALMVVAIILKISGVRRIVNEMGDVARNRREGTTTLVNMDEPLTRFDWDLVVKGQCDRVVEEAMTHWNDLRISNKSLE
jgi:NAD+-dependent protein deacetylase SIR2